MNGNEFVEAVKSHVRDVAVEDTIEFIKRPPGRKPRKKHVELSNWYNGLSEGDRNMVARMMEEAVDSSLFGLFCVIDGVRTIEESEEKTNFQLFGFKDDEQTLINNEDDESLHDIYNTLTNAQD